MLADSPVFTFEEAKEPLLRSWQVCCFTINVIMGSGFLGVPAGFTQAGLALGPAILLLVSLLQWAAACQIVQTASRAHALLLARSAETTLTPTLAPFAASLLKNEHGSPGARGQSEDVRPPSLTLPSHTSYEIMMLCRLHLGPVRRRLRATRDAAPSQRPRPSLYPLAHDCGCVFAQWAERVTMATSGLYMVGVLWSFISVFASSLAATVPLPWLEAGAPCDIYKSDVFGGGCITLYYWWVLTFAMLMAVLLALDLREQATFQCAMTLARLLVIVLMLGTLLLGERSDFGLSTDADADGASDAAPDAADDSAYPLVRWSGLPTMVPIGVFCQLFQIGVPSLLQPLGPKREFASVFGVALAATFLMYTALGLAAASFFGSDVDPACNLNWQAYQSRTVALIVALFPALDCLSVFPLNAVFLANNLCAAPTTLRPHTLSSHPHPHPPSTSQYGVLLPAPMARRRATPSYALPVSPALLHPSLRVRLRLPFARQGAQLYWHRRHHPALYRHALAAPRLSL